MLQKYEAGHSTECGSRSLGTECAVWKSPGYFLRHLSLLLARLLLYRNVCDQESDGLSLPPAPGTRRVHCTTLRSHDSSINSAPDMDVSDAGLLPPEIGILVTKDCH